jgi:hypothetical protein
MREWVPFWVVIVVISIVVSLYLYMRTGSEFYLFVVLIIGLGTPFIFLRVSTENPLLWSNAHRGTRIDFDRAIVLVQRPLRKAGVRYRLKGEKSYGFFIFKSYMDAVLLDNGLTITLTGKDNTMVTIGPVNDVTRRDVEWLMGLVDEVLW